MKRSNRLVLLVGVFLAVIAFVGVLVLSGGGPPEEPPPVTDATVIVAKEDIPLGTVIDVDMVEPKTVPLDGAEPDAFVDVSQVIGQTARQDVVAGGQVTERTLSGGVAGRIVDLKVPAGMRAMTLEVDQVTGVGTLIKTGDYVDMVVRVKIPLLPNTPIDNIWDTSAKLLLQGMQVIGVQLPVTVPVAEGETPAQPGTGLEGQRALVTLSLTAAQVEVVKWIQSPEGNTAWTTADPSVSLVLRSPTDFLDENGNPRLPESPCVTAPQPLPTPAASEDPNASPSIAPYRGCETTDGVVLTTLIEDYGVLFPALSQNEYFGGIALPSPTPEQ